MDIIYTASFHKYSSLEYRAVLVTPLVEVYVVITYHPPGQRADSASLTHRPEEASPSSRSINVLCLSWGMSTFTKTSICTITFTSHQVHTIIMTQHCEAGVPSLNKYIAQQQSFAVVS